MLERGAECHPRCGGDDRLDGEEQQQEQPADVRQLEQEEHAERDDGHRQHRPNDVEGLSDDGPPRAGAVEPVRGQGHHPAGRVEGQQDLGHGDHESPVHGPVRAEAQRGQPHQQRHGYRGIERHQQGAKTSGVSSDHRARSLGAPRTSPQWYAPPIPRLSDCSWWGVVMVDVSGPFPAPGATLRAPSPV